MLCMFLGPWQGQHLPNLVFVNTHYSALCPVLSTCTTCKYCTTTQCLLADSVLQSPNQNGIYIKLRTIFRYSAVPGALLNVVCFAAPLAVYGTCTKVLLFQASAIVDGLKRWPVELWPSCMLCTCTHLLASVRCTCTPENLDDGLKPVVKKWSLALHV